MSELVHHPNKYDRHTRQKLNAKNPHKQKHTGKTLTAKTPPMSTKFPLVRAAHWIELKDKFDASRQIAEAIQACLQEDLPEYLIQIQANTDGHYDININPPNIDAWNHTFEFEVLIVWMFTIGITGNNITLVRNHDGGEILDVGFILEDPQFFQKLVDQIKEWTPLERFPRPSGPLNLHQMPGKYQEKPRRYIRSSIKNRGQSQ